MSNKLAPATEILGAIVSQKLHGSDIESFKTDPAAFAYQKANMDLKNVELNVVENSGNTLHLALPYYSTLDNMDSRLLSDESMDDVAGGEIFGSLAVLIASVIAGTAAGVGVAGAAVGGITVTAIAAENAAEGKHIDGSSK